jgi:hypothetical protein
MRIIVNHLTRMKTHSRICVAGVDVVDVGDAVPRPNPPETEDWRFRTADAELVEMLEPEEYWEVLEEIQDGGIEEAFGPELHQRGRGFAIDEGRGLRSLAVVRAPAGLRLATNPWGKLQLSFTHDDDDISLSVGDVRFVEADHQTIRRDVVRDVDGRLRDGVDAYVMLGLPRAFVASGDDRPRHWVQVNGICLADRPVGAAP